MNNPGRLPKLSLIVGIWLAGLVLIATSQMPEVAAVADAAAIIEADAPALQVDPDDLPACGEYQRLRQFHQPEPTEVAAASAPPPTVAAPAQAAPTNTPRPAPDVDRVGFPENFATDYKLLFIFDRPDRRWLRVICGNDIAASRQPGEPFAYGSALVMISYTALLDDDGQLVLDEDGHYIGENFVAMHVQRKEPDFGEAYGADRSGEWEYMGYTLDGGVINPPQQTNSCAACHLNEAGDIDDFVFRMNLFHDGEAALESPPVGDDEISIYLYSFHEPVLEVKAGTTVTWINNDQATHTVVAAVSGEAGKIVAADDPLFVSGVLASVNIAAGDSFSFTFDQPGEYLYRCTIHENMVGRIIVTE